MSSNWWFGPNSIWAKLFGKKKSVTPTPSLPVNAMRPVGIFVGVAQAQVSLAGLSEIGVTSADGYFCWKQVPVSLGASHLTITAKDYDPYSQHIDMSSGNLATAHNIFVGVPPANTSEVPPIVLPGLVLSMPLPKSREARLNVRCNFCNLRDSKGRYIFSEAIAALPVEDQLDWIACEKAAGGTHYTLSPETGYPGYFAPMRNLFTEGVAAQQTFLECVWRVVKAGLVPIIFLAGGDSYPGDDYYRSLCTWLMTAAPTLKDYAIFVCAWEAVNGGYSSNEYNRCNLIMRSIFGPSALIASHLSPERCSFASHNSGRPADKNGVELDDPWGGDEVGCWHSLCGPTFDLFFFQSLAVRPGEVNQFGDPAWWDRALDCAERFLERGTPMPGAKGLQALKRQADGTMAVFHRSGVAGVDGPDWFEGRKRPVLVYFEGPAYHFIRGHITSDEVRDVASKAQSFGFTCFGNGLPR